MEYKTIFKCGVTCRTRSLLKHTNNSKTFLRLCKWRQECKEKISSLECRSRIFRPRYCRIRLDSVSLPKFETRLGLTDRGLDNITSAMDAWAQLGGGTGDTSPQIFRQWGYSMSCPPHFLFRLRNILVSHQPVPPHFTTKDWLLISSGQLLVTISILNEKRTAVSGDASFPLQETEPSAWASSWCEVFGHSRFAVSLWGFKIQTIFFLLFPPTNKHVYFSYSSHDTRFSTVLTKMVHCIDDNKDFGNVCRWFCLAQQQ